MSAGKMEVSINHLKVDGHTIAKLVAVPDSYSNNMPVWGKRSATVENGKRLALCWNSHDELIAALESVIAESDRETNAYISARALLARVKEA